METQTAGATVASVVHDGFVVESTGESEADLRANLVAEEAPKDGEPADLEQDKVSAAARELGKKGGEAAAKARAEKEEPEPKEAKAEESEEDKAENPRHSARARVMQATREAAELRRQNAELQERLSALEAKVSQPRVADESPKTATKPADPDAEPDEDSYGTYKEYVKAVARWAAQQEKRAALKEIEEREQAMAIHRQIESTLGGIRNRAQQSPDILAKAEPVLLQLTPSFRIENTDAGPRYVPSGAPPGPATALADEIMQSEYGLQIAAYLADNPEEYERVLASRNPPELVRAVGRLEALVSRPVAQARPEPAVSRAAPPVRPVQGGAVVDTPDPEGFDDYMRVHPLGRR